MLFVKVFILMVLCHIIDDFVLQPICLSKLKQKSYWNDLIREYTANGINTKKYSNDYYAGLIVHSLSWSIMIMLPIMFMLPISGLLLIGCIIINMIVHAYIDDLKANKYKINLIEDQLTHLLQIWVTFIIVVLNIII